MEKQIILLCTLLTWVTLSSSFTPPKIIYGGWVPILPGHPFYFGSAREKSHQYQESHHQHYNGQSQHFTQDYYSPEHSGHNGYSEHGQQYTNEDHQQPYQYAVQGQAHYTPSERHTYKPTTGIEYSKNAYSYYPHHSSYDKPAQIPSIQIKPVYIEIPRKPLDVYENPRNAPYVQKLSPEDFKVLDHGNEKAYLRITPIGQVPHAAISHIGQINFDKLQQLPNPAHHPITDDLIQPYRQQFLNHETNLHASPQSAKSSYVEDHRSNKKSKEYPTNYKLMNNFRGTNFPVEDPRSMQSITNKGFKRNHRNGKHLSNKHPYTSVVKAYPATLKTATAKSYYVVGETKADYVPESDQHTSLPKNKASLVQMLKNSLMPKMLSNYFHKNKQVGELYREPAVLTKIQGTPALVEREVAIVHVPVSEHQESSDEIKGQRKRGPFYGRTNNPHLLNSRPSSNPAYKYYLPHLPVNESQSNYESEEHQHYQNVEPREQAIFVSLKGIDDDDIQTLAEKYRNNAHLQSMRYPQSEEENQQVFHAYYAPVDHVPPKGYRKMSAKEFEKYFRDADIQYLRREYVSDAKRS